MAAVVFFFVAFVAIGIAIAARRYTGHVAEAWMAAASTLGLSYEREGFGRPRISGTLRGMRVQVDVRVQRSGNNQQTFTRYRVWVPPPGFQFRLDRQTGMSRVTKFFGAQDVEMGDAAFDDAFVVKTDDEARLRALLTPRLRGALVRTAAAYPGVQYEHDRVSFERRRLEINRDVIVSTMRRLVDTAAALADGKVLEAEDDVLAARARGELADIAEKMRSATASKAKTLEDRLLELDTLATAGEHSAASERLRDLELTVPADPEVVGWKQRLDRPQAPATPLDEQVDAEEMSREVFSGNALSFESKRVFDERYAGRSVRWSGRVKSTGTIGTSSDLGPAGDDRLVATVATINHDLYGNTDIDAVVGLPTGAASGLRRDDDVMFTGTLVGVDALVRNVFVAGGRLE